MTEQAGSVTLFGARDTQGRTFLVDDRAHLPEGAVDVREFAVAPDRMQGSILAVELEEIRGIPVTIEVGDYRYRT
jgi:hypothetical protein